jgi:NADP-dependent 3-hydroxy acid dehydrogenase YdfG
MKTVLITGATSGFGKAIAEDLALKNYRLIITGRRKNRLTELAKSLSEKGGDVHTLAFDVQERKAVEAAIGSLPENWKTIDVLINNAGLALGKSFLTSGDTQDWDTMLDTNVKGLLYVTRSTLPFLKNAAQGHIINIGSIAGTEVYPGGNVYCASKHAVNALSKALRQELLSDGIRVSQIRPGLAETEFSLVRFKGDADKASEAYKGYQALMAEDIARVTTFIMESPAHVCINDLEITPTAQANAALVHKNA